MCSGQWFPFVVTAIKDGIKVDPRTQPCLEQDSSTEDMSMITYVIIYHTFHDPTFVQPDHRRVAPG